MAIFAIGDPHLSFGVSKPMDIFSGWGDYVRRLEDNWRDIVRDEDTVVLVGDISWGMSLSESLPDFVFLDSLPGTKLIVKGNHDYWWSTMTKMTAFFSENSLDSLKILHNNSIVIDGIPLCGTRGWVSEDGQDNARIMAREAGRLRMSLEAAKRHGGDPIVFMHYPVYFSGKSSDEIMAVLEEYGVREFYYGHIHGSGCKYAFTGMYKNINMQLVSADFLEFKPFRVR